MKMSLAELFYSKHPRRSPSMTARRRRRRPGRSKVLLEPLEPRVLLDAQPLSLVAATAVDLSIHLVDDDGTLTVEIVDNNASSPTASVVASQPLAETSG